MRAAHRAVIARLPDMPGVYRFRDARDRTLYIGRASNLRHRVGSYWLDLSDRRHLTRMVPQIARIEAVVCDSAHEAAWLERNVLEQAKPRWNRTCGTESAMCIRLDRTSGVPRLAVVHWPFADTADGPAAGVDMFGPYLGGARARLAASALERALPLRYTDDQLRGAQRDLARVRGVEPADRDELLNTLTAMLRGQPEAVAVVRQKLVRHRDRASARLAYELAARVQQEIEALEWIVAEQKVTRLSPIADPSGGAPTPTDYAVYGWADGLLLRYRIRRGRLCEWGQRASSQPAARRYLDRTPTGWDAFTARNAELASRLADAYVAS